MSEHEVEWEIQHCADDEHKHEGYPADVHRVFRQDHPLVFVFLQLADVAQGEGLVDVVELDFFEQVADVQLDFFVIFGVAGEIGFGQFLDLFFEKTFDMFIMSIS